MFFLHFDFFWINFDTRFFFFIFCFLFYYFFLLYFILCFFERMITRYKTMILGTKGFIFGSIIIQIVLRRTGAWLRLLVLHFVFF
jgi:hypothetical protein